MYTRNIKKQIIERLGKGKAIIIFGARRVGKTTLAKEVLETYPEPVRLYLDCDLEETQASLSPTSLSHLKRTIGTAKCVVIDEAQRVTNIGLTIKIIVDNMPDVQVIATGSSSFELANRIKEPLTGRAYDFMLYPLSLNELGLTRFIDINTELDRLLIFGAYPSIAPKPDTEAIAELETITSSYILKDLIELADIRQQQILPRLLRALALQIGGEVSFHELANLLDVKADTIQRYIVLLEAACIVYRLDALSGNERNKLSSRKRKVYFYDLGVRNALIENLNPLSLRADVGQLWENFCMNERMKYRQDKSIRGSSYYWRGLYGEVDLVEQKADKFDAYEFKYKDKKVTTPQYFAEAYPEADLKVIHRENLHEWLV